MAKIIMAMRKGVQGRFSELAWERGRMPEQGWVIVSKKDVTELGDEIIPVEDVEIDEIPLENFSESDESEKKEPEKTKEEIEADKIIEEKKKEIDVLNKQIADGKAIAKALPKKPPPLKGVKGKYVPVNVETEKVDQTQEMEMEAMKGVLRNKGVKFHHMLGYTNLKKLYNKNMKDENTK